MVVRTSRKGLTGAAGACATVKVVANKHEAATKPSRHRWDHRLTFDIRFTKRPKVDQ